MCTRELPGLLGLIRTRQAFTDPGHTHTQTTINDDFNSSAGNPPGFIGDSAGSMTWNNINSATTGLSVDSGGAHSHVFTTGNTGGTLACFT